MKLVLFLLFFSTSVFALDEATLKYLERNNIILKTDGIIDEDVMDFLSEYQKFPLHLREEMISRRAKIHLIHGHGVTDDPSWGMSKKTFDGRDWSTVPGAGGSPKWGRPTRIVVNRMYEGHGSENLFLHEHAHALDSTYKTDGVSSSREWRSVLKNSPNAESYLSRICRDNYCLVEREGFAELFTRYFNSEETRLEIEQELPLIAEFFRNLKSIKNLPKGPAGNRGSGPNRILQSVIDIFSVPN